jgi:F0F1-type ATP synthase delta subunit
VEYKLPVTIATRTQLVNVYENLKSVLEKGIQNNIRANEGVDFEDLPEVSSALAEIIKENNIKVDNQSLKELEAWMGDLKHTAPVVRFTFASDPENEVVARIVKWLRDESGKEVLVRIGVQPTIAAGCIVHTPSHQYDFSLRNHLLENVPLFTKILNEKIAPSTPERVAETVVAP